MDINYKDFKILRRGETGWVYIYILKDPITYEVRYVGKAKDVVVRFKEHIRKSHLSKTHKNNWIQKLLNNLQKPMLEVIAIVPEETWGIHEQYWIDRYREDGAILTNIANGGVGGNLGAVVNEKIRQSRMGVKASNETKLKMSKSHSGEHNHMYGKNHSVETKEKIKNKLMVLNSGKNNPFFGKTHSEAFKEKKRKKVQQLNIDGTLIKIWGSISEAAASLDIQQSGISGVCDKENKTYYNYKWVKLIDSI